MRRISVGATVRDAYAFVGAHLGGIIGLIWLPMVLITVAQFFTFYRCYNDFIDALAGGNPAHMGPALLMLLGYVVAKLLLTALMCVGVVQLAMGGRTAPALISITFGPPEGRLFRAFCGFAGLLLLIGITVLTLGNMVMAMNAVPSRQLQEAVSGLMMLALLSVGLLLSATSWNTVQARMADLGGAQCGYCTPGIVLTADRNTTESDQESSAVGAAAQVFAITGDRAWLKRAVAGRPLIARLDAALESVRAQRFDAARGLVTAAFTADWGDSSTAMTLVSKMTPALADP